MDVTPLVPKGRQIIQAYGDGGFRVSGVRHQGAILIFPERTLTWSVAGPDGMTLESLAAVTGAVPRIEILLLGTGARMTLVPAGLRRAFQDAAIALDAMDTGAACRTYNVLMAEDRRVAAALLATG
jgi:uncharacterized protein